MGRHTERLRELIAHIPKSPKGFTPEIASMALTQLANGALQVISQLEEAMDDLEAENARLTEMVMEKQGDGDAWTPSGE